MKNPWKALPQSAPFILPQDKQKIIEGKDEEYLQRYLERNERELSIVPIPFMGDLSKATVILLLLNPGFSNNGHSDIEMQKQHPNFVKKLRSNLMKKHADGSHFLLLNKTWAFYTGFGWWYRNIHKAIDRVIEKIGKERNEGWNRVRKNLGCLNFFPYHSKQFQNFNHSLPSQEYAVNLLKLAMEKNKPYLILRGKPGKSIWEKAIPGLLDYPHKDYFKVQRMCSITPKNLVGGDKSFEKICSELSKI